MPSISLHGVHQFGLYAAPLPDHASVPPAADSGRLGASIFFSLTLCVGAVVLFRRGTFLIGAQRAAILSTFEPITSIFAGILFLNETLTLRILLGSSSYAASSVLITQAAAKGRDDPNRSAAVSLSPRRSLLPMRSKFARAQRQRPFPSQVFSPRHDLWGLHGVGQRWYPMIMSIVIFGGSQLAPPHGGSPFAPGSESF